MWASVNCDCQDRPRSSPGSPIFDHDSNDRHDLRLDQWGQVWPSLNHENQAGIRGDRAGSPWGITPPGLPQIRTCPLGHTARQVMFSLRSAASRCALTCRRVPMHPPCFPANGVMTKRPLLSTGSRAWFPRFVDTMGRSDPPPSFSTRFEFFTSQYHRFARGLLPSVVGVPPGARELSVPVSPSGITMETTGSLRFLGNPGGHCPCSSTPAGSGSWNGPWLSCLTRPPPVSRTKAPSGLYFRGSITQPLTSLSTLRGMGRPIATQDSLLAAGPALPGGICTRRASTKGFKVRVSSSFPRLFLTQGHHT